MSTLLITQSLQEGKVMIDGMNEVNKLGVVCLEKRFKSTSCISFLYTIQCMLITAYTGLF